MDKVWKIFSEELNIAHLIHDLNIHSFELMSNHYHLIVSTPKSDLNECTQRFSQRTSLRITKFGKRINQKPDEEKLKSVKYALTRPILMSLKCKTKRSPLISENDCI